MSMRHRWDRSRWFGRVISTFRQEEGIAEPGWAMSSSVLQGPLPLRIRARVRRGCSTVKVYPGGWGTAASLHQAPASDGPSHSRLRFARRPVQWE